MNVCSSISTSDSNHLRILQVMIPFSYKSQSLGILTSLVYSVTTDTWTQGPAPTLLLGRYAVTQGAFS
jgi:hypothetical protein